MTFVDCIRTAVTTDKIKPAKGAAAEQVYNNELAAALASGMSRSAAEDAAASAAVDAITKLTAEARWRRINEMRRTHEIYELFQNSKDLRDTLITFFDGIESAHHRVSGQAMALMAQTIEKYRPRLAGLWHPVSDMTEIARAAFGQPVKNPVAKVLADELLAAMEYLRKSANAVGATIPQNPNRRLPQTHDWIKVRRYSETEWVNDHINTLDWTLMRYKGKPIAVADRAAVLKITYEGIRTDGTSRIVPGHSAADHLAARISQSRFLYYKDADAYLAMQKKYGSGNMFQQTIGLIDSMSRDIAMLEKMGPNPGAMHNFINNLVQRKAGDESLKSDVSQVSGVRWELNRFEERFKIFNMLVLNGEDSLLAQGMAATRTVLLASKLDGAYLANIGDFALMKNTAMANKLPGMSIIKAYVQNFVPNEKNRMFAMRSGLIAESAISMASAYQRYFGALDGPVGAKRYADFIFRVGWLTAHTQAAKFAWKLEFMGMLADHAAMKFDDLPFVDLFKEKSITKADWDFFRQTKIYDHRGAKFLRPIDVIQQYGPGTREADIANKFMDVILDTGREAVVTPTTREQAALGGAQSAATASGQLLRGVAQLKTFIVTITMRNMRTIMRNPTAGGKLAAAARFFTLLTVGGALVTQLKELANGKDLMDMNITTNPMFWVRAALNGGSFGFLGDAVLGSTMSGRDISTSITGPLGELADDTQNIGEEFIKLFNDEESKIAGRLVTALSTYGPKPWQVRLLIDRHIRDTMLQHTDPAAYRRMVRAARKQERETGQGMWWRYGESSPDRAPSFENIFGE